MVMLTGDIGGKHLICYRNGEEAEAGECAGTRW
jgi:hypothetical protein